MSIKIRLVTSLLPHPSFHSPPSFLILSSLHWFKHVAISSGWINRAKPWKWLKEKQSLALNSYKGTRDGLASAGGGVLGGVWAVASVYSCYGDHMQEDKGHWGVCVRVCACVCAVLTCLQPFKCFRNEFKVYVIISTHAELNHGDILQSVQGFCLTRTAAVLWWSTVVDYLVSPPSFVLSEQICTENTRVSQQYCVFVLDYQPQHMSFPVVFTFHKKQAGREFTQTGT